MLRAASACGKIPLWVPGLNPEFHGCAVLRKPLDPETLLAEVARCVGR